jgi:predicted transcriptional regulator
VYVKSKIISKEIIHLGTCNTTNNTKTQGIRMNEQDKSLQSNNTERILKFIHERSACHLRQIKKELNISMGTV